MNSSTKDKKLMAVVLLIVLAALTRLLPHPPNVTPITAMGLLGVAYLRPRWLAFVFTLGALWLSNLALDNIVYAQYYDHFMWFSNPGVFISFALVLGLASLAFRQIITVRRIAFTAVGASLLFWLASNFFVWLQSGMYPLNASGLVACYAAALPFLRNALLGDVFFTVLLFGAFHLVVSGKFLAKKVN